MKICHPPSDPEFQEKEKTLKDQNASYDKGSDYGSLASPNMKGNYPLHLFSDSDPAREVCPSIISVYFGPLMSYQAFQFSLNSKIRGSIQQSLILFYWFV